MDNDKDTPPTSSVWKRSTLARFGAWLCTGRVLRRLLILTVWLFTLLALTYAFENWRGRRAWNQYREQVEARGEQLNWQTFIPKPVPEDQNSVVAPFFESWFTRGKGGARDQRWNSDSYARLHNKIGPSNARRNQGERNLIDLSGWELAFAAERAGKIERGQRFESGLADKEARAKAAAAVLEGLSSHAAAFAELREASQRPLSRHPIVYDLENPWGILVPHLGHIKAICQRLELKACAELALSRPDAALTDVKLMFYLIDSVEPEPFLISYLVRVACVQLAAQPIWEGLAERRWAEPQLQELQQRLQQMDFLTDMQHSLRAERAAGVLTTELIRKKGLGLLDSLAETGPNTDRAMMNMLGMFIPSGWYYLEQLNYCRLFDAQILGTFDLAPRRIAPRQIEANVHELESKMRGGLTKGFQGILTHHAIAGLLLPGLQKVPYRAAVGQTAVDQAALGCALERHRLATGQFPETLAALVPRFIPTLPTDLLSGKPYQYHRTDDGRFVLYSVGWDQSDDAGAPGRLLFDEKRGDWVWQYPGK